MVEVLLDAYVQQRERLYSNERDSESSSAKS